MDFIVDIFTFGTQFLKSVYDRMMTMNKWLLHYKIYNNIETDKFTNLVILIEA